MAWSRCAPLPCPQATLPAPARQEVAGAGYRGCEQAVASCRSASSIRGRNGTVGSAVYQRLIAQDRAGQRGADSVAPLRSGIPLSSAVGDAALAWAVVRGARPRKYAPAPCPSPAEGRSP